MSTKVIRTIVAFISLYVICQAIADVGATKMLQIGKFVMPAGTLIFAFTFTLRDMLHKRLGKTWAQSAIVMAALCNVLQAGYLAIMARLPYPSFYAYGEAWSSIFAIVPAITIASIIAELVSELIDTEIYHQSRLISFSFGKLPQWMAVLLSNIVSLPVDSFIFGVLAFVVLPPLFGAQSVSFLIAMSLMVGQIAWKSVVTVVSLPLIYLVKDSSIIPSGT